MVCIVANKLFKIPFVVLCVGGSKQSCALITLRHLCISPIAIGVMV